LSIETTIRGVNPAAPVYRTVRAQIDPKLVMGIGAYNTVPPQFRNSSVNSEAVPSREESPHHPTNEAHTHHHYTTRGISSLQITCPPLDSPTRLAKLDEWIRTLLWENTLPWYTSDGQDAQDERKQPSSVQVFRCKGIFRMCSGQEYILQGVRSLYELREVDSVGGDGGLGKVVLIGKGLDERVRRSFEGIFS
jgi:G3E family GTPase